MEAKGKSLVVVWVGVVEKKLDGRSVR